MYSTLPPEVVAGRRAFGDRLRELRERAELTQETLAEHAGIDRKTVNRIEGGRYSPRLDVVFRLAVVLSHHPRELFD